jgi:hypothetical protein
LPVKTGLLLAFLFGATLSFAVAQTGDKRTATARACISVVNSLNNDEEALRSDTTGRRGLKINAYLDSTVACDALAAVFTKTGQALTGCRPQFVTLAARNEVTLPKAPVAWNWEKDPGPIEGYVVFFAKGSKESAEVRALVAAIQGTTDDKVLRLQTSKLRELIGRANVDRSAQSRPKTETEVAGTYRMVVGFDWHSAARTVEFSADKPGALGFPTSPAR